MKVCRTEGKTKRLQTISRGGTMGRETGGEGGSRIISMHSQGLFHIQQLMNTSHEGAADSVLYKLHGKKSYET